MAKPKVKSAQPDKLKRALVFIAITVVLSVLFFSLILLSEMYLLSRLEMWLNLPETIVGFVLPSLALGVALLVLMSTAGSKGKRNTLRLTVAAAWVVAIVFFILLTFYSSATYRISSPLMLAKSCIAASGFYCQNPIYNHATGAVSAVIGQSTGMYWTDWGYAYAKEGTPFVKGVPTAVFTVSSSSLRSGSTTNILTLAALGATSVGTTTSGGIWVCYVLNGTISSTGAGYCLSNSTVHYEEIATLTATAS